MGNITGRTFIVDCPRCKAKVAAHEDGRSEKRGMNEDSGEPFGVRLHVGRCPICNLLLAGESYQIAFAEVDSDEDVWSNADRIFPNPPKTFTSDRIPRVVKDSLTEADRTLQANANVAACVMLGRAFEAVCRDVLAPQSARPSAPSSVPVKRRDKIMLGAGIKQMKDKGIIDQRLFDWSQQLQAFRNLAAHPEDVPIPHQDAEDLQSFVHAIVEYIYDLTDRYNEFKARIEKKAKKK